MVNTFRQHRSETAALFTVSYKHLKVQGSSSVGRGFFLLQTQLMSFIQSHYFSERQVANRHIHSFGCFYLRLGKWLEGVFTMHYINPSVFQLLSSHAPSHGVSYVLYVGILSCFCLGQVCYIEVYVCLREVPCGSANILPMFLVRTRNLCMHQNAYCSHMQGRDGKEEHIFQTYTQSKENVYPASTLRCKNVPSEPRTHPLMMSLMSPGT